MQLTLGVLNHLVDDRVIDRYAITGGVASYRYIEPALTVHLDVLVGLNGTASTGLVALQPVFAALRTMGHGERRYGGVVVAGWPVLFWPAVTPLDAEALAGAEPVELVLGGQTLTTQVVRPDHLALKAIALGRPKDYARVAELIELGLVDQAELVIMLDRFGLLTTWTRFLQRTGLVLDQDH